MDKEDCQCCHATVPTAEIKVVRLAGKVGVGEGQYLDIELDQRLCKECHTKVTVGVPAKFSIGMEWVPATPG